MGSVGYTLFSCCIACCMALVLLFSGVTVVPVGYVGVVSLLGSVDGGVLYAGLSFVNPMSSVALYSTQTQVLHFSDNVPTQEGVNVRLECSCLFHLSPEAGIRIFENFGQDRDMVRTALIPLFESTVREVTSAHTAAALYTATARVGMTQSLKEQLGAFAAPYGVVVESTPINKLVFPQLITEAIERKMQLQQEAETMTFVLEKEKQEADRKIIEANGILKAQQIIANSTTDAVLQWNALGATETLGASCGAKMVCRTCTNKSIGTMNTCPADLYRRQRSAHR